MSDDRLGAGSAERVVDLALGPDAEGLPIAWRVAYERKLVLLVKAEVKGSKPQLVCMRPNVARRFAFDLATGELEAAPVEGKK